MYYLCEQQLYYKAILCCKKFSFNKTENALLIFSAHIGFLFNPHNSSSFVHILLILLSTKLKIKKP